MTARPLHGVPWQETGDLAPQEKEAVALYLGFSREVQHYLRHPRELADAEEWPWFQALVQHLDTAISRSHPPPGTLLYRGVRDGDFTRRILFLLSVDPGCTDGEFHPITPQIIQDPGYTSFAGEASRIPGRSGDGLRVLFVYRTGSPDRALYVGGKDSELLFPRGVSWMATGYLCIPSDGGKEILISIEQFSGGG